MPKILDRLHSFYIQLCEEKENNQNTEPFSHLNSVQTNNGNNSINPSPRKKSKMLHLLSDL